MENNLTVTGVIVQIGDTQQVSEKFSKREFAIEMQEDVNGKMYSNYAKLQLTQAKCGILDKYKLGDTITAAFNIKGFKWERDGKTNYGTNLDVWRITPAGEATPEPQPQANASYISFEEETRNQPNDNLPF